MAWNPIPNFPLGKFSTQVQLRVGRSTELAKDKHYWWLFQMKNKMKSESDSENEASEFPNFVLLESFLETCPAKLSPFLIEKVISSWATLQTIKKTRNGNLLTEVESWRHDKNILKWSCSPLQNVRHTTCQTYLPLKLAISEEIEIALGKQGVMDFKRIAIWRNEEVI